MGVAYLTLMLALIALCLIGIASLLGLVLKALLHIVRSLDPPASNLTLGAPVHYTSKAVLMASKPVQQGQMLVASYDGMVEPAPVVIGTALEDSKQDGKVLVGVVL